MQPYEGRMVICSTSVLRTTGCLIDSCHWAQYAATSIHLYFKVFQVKVCICYWKPVFWELLGMLFAAVAGLMAQQSAFSYIQVYCFQVKFFKVVGNQCFENYWVFDWQLSLGTWRSSQHSTLFHICKLCCRKPAFWELLGRFWWLSPGTRLSNKC